ncbi:MAG: hypothetical protein KBC30_05005 [Planctomycetes bacterium]|nr:hypothetical protein [Planctomycetota bacterium]
MLWGKSVHLLWGGKYCSGEKYYSALGNMLWGIYSEEVNVSLGENIALGRNALERNVK